LLQLVFILTIPVLSACADRVTDATSPSSLSSSSSSTRSFPTTLASVGWQEQGRLLVADHPVTMSPVVAVRVYALLGVAQYGAVVDADKQVEADGSLTSDGFGDGGRSRFEAERGASAAASARILSYIFTDAATALAQRLSAEANAGPGGVHPSFTRGAKIGSAFADMLWARNDGYSNAWTGTLSVGEGFWTRNPAPVGGTLPPLAAPQFAAMKPYFLTSAAQLHSATPPTFGSTAFYTDLAEVSTISRTRSETQLAAAVAWNLANGTVTALGRWDEFASQFITDNRLDEVIGCWEAKFSYDYIRPYQVDQTAYPITTPIGRPNHPSYPSGHSCVSAAAATVIKAFFPEHGEWLDARVVDAGMSRIYGGLHYRFDITAGQALGRAAAGVALAYDRDRGLLASVR
jgi:membrane-associated phospholipid phosphatase